MTHAVILGGSVVGSALALQLARSGWRVTMVDPELALLESPAPAPRPGAPHVVQAHGFMSRTLLELRTRLPDIVETLVARGAPLVPLAEIVPPFLHDGGREGDEELLSMRSRRWLVDSVIAEAVRHQDGITRIAARATGLVLGEGSPPRITGLRLAGGEIIAGDVVVDAGGRRSPVAGWLAEVGVVQPTRIDPCRVRYYTRHYRLRDGAEAPIRFSFAAIHDFPSLSQLIFLGDNGTAMFAHAVHAEDRSLSVLRRPEAFDAVAAANPELDAWREVLEPTSPVFCLGAFDNRMRRLVDHGRPVVRGLHQVGDARAMTNPTRGRGVAMGLATVGVLHDLLVADGNDPDAVQLAVDDWAETALATYYRESAAVDVALCARLTAGLGNLPGPGNAPAVELPEGHPISSAELEHAAERDPEVFRVLIRAFMLLDDERAVASPEVVDRVRRVLADAPASPSPNGTAQFGGLHDRAELERLLAPFR